MLHFVYHLYGSGLWCEARSVSAPKGTPSSTVFYSFLLSGPPCGIVVRFCPTRRCSLSKRRPCNTAYGGTDPQPPARSRHVRRRHGQIWSRASLLVHPTTLRELERFPSTQYRPGWTTFHAAPKNPLDGSTTTVWIYGLQNQWEAVRGSSVRSRSQSRRIRAHSITLDRYPCSSGVGGPPLRRRRHR